MMNKSIIAIYGGSFNPPTIAHENIVRDILNLEIFDKVVYLPVGDSYNKETLISSKYRFEMLNILTNKLKKENLNVEINRLEIDASKRLYTLESLRILKKEYKQNLAFVMGTDNIKEFHTWYNPDILLEEFYFVVIQRSEDDVLKLIKDDELLCKYKDKFIIVKETSYSEVNSTYIRNNIYNDEKIERHIDKKVLQYIKSNNLYKGGSYN
ncbi:MAG: nicotinate (nicotinamide) nucleotide adenylyltransferase [Sarcina sp.]